MVMFDFLYGISLIGVGSLVAVLVNSSFVSDTPSEYELKRRAKDGDGRAKKNAWLKKHTKDVSFTVTLMTLFAYLLFVVLLLVKLSVMWSAVVAGLVLLVSRFVFVEGYLDKIFDWSQKRISGFLPGLVGLLKKRLKFFYGKKNGKEPGEPYRAYYSEEEFDYRLGLDGEVLSAPTQLKLKRMLGFRKVKSKDLMLPVKNLPRVDVNIGLTPIVYDELHRQGFDVALAYEGQQDNLIGVLYLATGGGVVDEMSGAGSIRIGDKIERGLQYVREDVALEEIVSGFLQSNQSAVLVTSPNGRVSGVITIKMVLGWISGI